MVKVPLGKALKKMVAEKKLTKVKSSFKLVKVEKPKPKKKKAPKKKVCAGDVLVACGPVRARMCGGTRACRGRCG